MMDKGGRTFARLVGRRLVVLSALALMMLTAVGALILVQGINRQISDVTQTYEVRNQARELAVALSEAESSQRGYLLSGDRSYLDIYRGAAAAAEARLVSLTELTRGDPQQAALIARIASDIATRSAEMARTLEVIDREPSADADALIATGAAELPMDEIRGALTQFTREEDQRLIARNEQIEAWRRWLVGALIAALAAAVVLVYTLFARTLRELRLLSVNTSVLESENEVLEAHVRDRTKALEEARAHAEHERQRVEAMLQDTNHRIGNSLATVSSLLGLQLLRSRSDEVREALESARSRVHAIAAAHRRLRLGHDLETASADEFLTAVVEDIEATVTKPVSIAGEIEPIVIGARDATTVGILVGELVTNALKHGFPEGRAGRVTVQFRRVAGVPTLTVADDGVGISVGAEPGEGGLGSVIVRQLAMQLGGAPQYERVATGGLVVTVPLPGVEGPGADRQEAR